MQHNNKPGDRDEHLIYILYCATTDATPTELTLDGAAGSGSSNRIPIPNNSAYSIIINASIKQAGSANCKQMQRKFMISNNGGTTSIQGAIDVSGTDPGSAALVGCVITLTANDDDDCLKVMFTGLLATNLKIKAGVIVVDVTD